jgi:serine/threonine protein kinase/WD40 repeat protein
MSGPGLQQVEKLFHDALALAPEQRAAFLETRCAGDAALRTAVEQLLRHDREEAQTDTFLASPVAGAAARMRADVPTQAEPCPDVDPGLQPVKPEIAGYDLLEELGRGGMGVVYKARQVGLNRLVALKMLRPDNTAGPEMLARFRLEAEALARLQHPNIIAIYDIGTAEGRPYFSMEYVAGGSLAQVLDGRPQDIAASARLVETLARTMDAVHRQGIVHRDLKPANILLSTELKVLSTELAAAILSTQHSALSTFVPKISDFGLAKVRSTAQRLTQTGMVMGTLCYMAPEQARSGGSGVGPAADQFALGAILYELLTGRPPFEAPTPAQTITQLLNDEPLSPQRLRPKVPRDLATICLKCLEKSPRRRYASTLALAEDLRRFQTSKPIHARPVGLLGRLTRWCRRRPLVAASLLLSGILALGLVITVLVYEARLEQALLQAENKAELERQQLVETNIKIGQAELERADAFAALLRFTEALRLDEGPPERERAHRLRIATTLRQCPRLVQLRMYREQVLCTNLEPDGGWLAMVGNKATVQVCEVSTGRPAGPTFAVPEPPKSGAVSRDGRWLISIGTRGEARFRDVRAGTSEELPCHEKQAIVQAVFHPEGRILVTRHADKTMRLWNLTNGPLRLPGPVAGGPLASSALSDNARWLFTVDEKRAGQLWDVATVRPAGKPVALDQNVSLTAVGPGGRRVAVVSSDGALRVWDVQAGRWEGNPMRSAQAITHIAFAPDEQRLHISVGATPSLQIWRHQATELVTILAQLTETATQARFSHRGHLVLATDHAGAGRVWDASTGRAVTPPLRHGRPLTAAEVSLDGRQLLTVGQDGTVATWLLPQGAGATSKAAAPDERPITELTALAQLLTCARIDAHQVRQDLTPSELWSTWQQVSKLVPN